MTALLIFDASAAAQTLRTLYNFTGGSNGSNPAAAVVIGDGGGVLYGASAGGSSNNGTVFSLTPPASPGGAWTEAVLFTFTGGTDGAYPDTGTVMGQDGVLCGTTYSGGLSSNSGTVFSLSPPASPGGAWTKKVLHRFAGGPTDGANPNAGIVIGRDGVLYGTTVAGGTSGAGTVFSITPPATAGGTWAEAVLYNFTGESDGLSPFGGMVIASRGLLYGTTRNGGISNSGIVFSLTPPASPGGTWSEAVLYNFTGGSDGGFPVAGVVISHAGVLYGLTTGGGTGGAPPDFVLGPYPVAQCSR
jgi:uncharacterized repeat protein (TIGR03803 family)